ncbi:MAG: hypothetical protein PHP23_02420 [Desulfobacterales bacterium]|nr:hypothetical protein [Desulfobacterales bacterium]MDD4071107.1 hypothetical protein [Desulfobacterales bacterium]MDD4393550.1 hypothetical protein [Desulfobacterales bacterium]
MILLSLISFIELAGEAFVGFEDSLRELVQRRHQWNRRGKISASAVRSSLPDRYE